MMYRWIKIPKGKKDVWIENRLMNERLERGLAARIDWRMGMVLPTLILLTYMNMYFFDTI